MCYCFVSLFLLLLMCFRFTFCYYFYVVIHFTFLSVYYYLCYLFVMFLLFCLFHGYLCCSYVFHCLFVFHFYPPTYLNPCLAHFELCMVGRIHWLYIGQCLDGSLRWLHCGQCTAGTIQLPLKFLPKTTFGDPGNCEWSHDNHIAQVSVWWNMFRQSQNSLEMPNVMNEAGDWSMQRTQQIF